MADPRPNSDPNDETATPRWVRVFGIIAAVLILLFIGFHLAGGGFQGHLP